MFARATTSALAIVAALTLSADRTFADRCLPTAGPRLYTADTGLYGLRLAIDPSTKQPRGTLVTSPGTGKERVVWEASLLAVPHRTFVSPDGGAVVTIDVECRHGFEHALVIYGAAGKVLADYRLEDLLAPAEIRSHVLHSISSRLWSEGAAFSFEFRGQDSDPIPGRLRIRLAWGKEILIDLVTGKILARGPDRPPQ